MFAPTISIVSGDITKLEVECIVNAANEYLVPGGGVCGAIHKGAGPELKNACKLIGFCAEGNTVITSGYSLNAKYVIHAVGPQYFKNPLSAPSILESCYRNSLNLAESNGVESIAFPCISTGVFGYPAENAARIAIQAVKNFRSTKVRKIIFCCFLLSDEKIYKSLI